MNVTAQNKNPPAIMRKDPTVLSQLLCRCKWARHPLVTVLLSANLLPPRADLGCDPVQSDSITPLRELNDGAKGGSAVENGESVGFGVLLGGNGRGLGFKLTDLD